MWQTQKLQGFWHLVRICASIQSPIKFPLSSLHSGCSHSIIQDHANKPRPRLSECQVEELESEFRQNQKPNTNRKRELAKQLGVDQARINVSPS